MPAQNSLCAAEFLDLTGAIWLGDFTNDKDYKGLLCKKDSAVLKVAAGKYDDAIVNLEDIDAKAQTLAEAAKPKLGHEAADSISSAAQATIQCIKDRP